MNMTDYLAMFGSPRASDMDIQSMLNPRASDIDIQSMRNTLSSLPPSARANYGLVQTPMQMKSKEQLAAELDAINEAIDLNLKEIQRLQGNTRVTRAAASRIPLNDPASPPMQPIGETRGFADEMQPTPPMQQMQPTAPTPPMGPMGAMGAAIGAAPTASEELMQRVAADQTRASAPGFLQGVDALVRQVADTINRGEPITQAQKEVIDAALAELGVSVKDFNRAVGNLVQTQRAMEAQAAENPFYNFSIRPTDELGSVVDVDTVDYGEASGAKMSPGALGGALDSAEEFPGFAGGGYVGRGTMAGELAPRGSMSVREAGETMFERMKRMRGYAGGGAVDHSPSSGVRRTMANALSPSMQRRIFG